MPAHSVTERQSLADALLAAGAGAATLCAGWTARDLAAHLVAREWRPDATVAGFMPVVRGWSERVRRGYLKRPFEDVVAQFRSGPPTLSWSGIPALDARLNLGEFLVHHEDVLRGTPGAPRRELSPELERAVWASAVGAGRFLLRRAGVGVELAWPAQARRERVREGQPVAVISGDPVELLLYVFGRRQAADVEVTGQDAAVEALQKLDLHV